MAIRPDYIPQNILGWSIAVSGGFIRAFKRVPAVDREKYNGRSIWSIYIGTEWNENAVRKKIRSKLKTIESADYNKELLAIDFLQRNEPRPWGYYLGFSGGKDSLVCYDLAKKAKVKFRAFYNNVNIDPPELKQYIRDRYPDVIWNPIEPSFYKMIDKCGFPSRNNRWCCRHMKEGTSGKQLHHNFKILGIRGEESKSRKERGMISRFPAHQTVSYHPIHTWKEWEVWEYINKYKLDYNPLYDDDNIRRIGCVCCPYIFNSRLIDMNRNKWPRIFNAFEHACHKEWKKRLADGRIKTKNFDNFLMNYYGSRADESFISSYSKNPKPWRKLMRKTTHRIITGPSFPD